MISIFHSIREFLQGDGAVALPEMELLLFAAGILVIDRWMKAEAKYWNVLLALGGTGFSGYTLWILRERIAVRGIFTGLHETLQVGPWFVFFAGLLLISMAMVILLFSDAISAQSGPGGSLFALLLLACVGMMLMISAIHLIVIFAGIELTAFSFYFLQRRFQNAEFAHGSLRRMLRLGAFGSAMLIGVFLLLYWKTGSMDIAFISSVLNERMRSTVSSGGYDLFAVALSILCSIAFLFKTASIFGFSLIKSADESANSLAVSAFFIGSGFVAAFILFLSLAFIVFGGVFGALPRYGAFFWQTLAIVLLLVGHVGALRQKSLTRILGWSSLAQIGFLFLDLLAVGEDGLAPMVFSLLVFLFVITGAFTVAVVIRSNGTPYPVGCAVDDGDNLRGLFRRSPMLAIALLIFLLTLAGVPLTAGFVGKYSIVRGLIATRHTTTVMIAIISLLPGFYYYFRVVTLAFLPPILAGDTQPFRISTAQTFVLTVTVFVSLAAGLYSEPFLQLARYAFER